MGWVWVPGVGWAQGRRRRRGLASYLVCLEDEDGAGGGGVRGQQDEAVAFYAQQGVHGCVCVLLCGVCGGVGGLGG